MKFENFLGNDDIKVVDEKEPFRVIEYQRDLSVHPENAVQSFFCSKMGIRRRQLMCKVGPKNITLQAGSMQWMAGNVSATTGIKGLGDMVSKAIRGKATGESAVKPEYTGSGMLVLEPTYKHILLLDVADWGGSVVLDDGLFLACDASLKHKTVMRDSFSSAVAGGEGLFNLAVEGNGIVCLEVPCPKEELMLITLEDDTLKIDGNLAIAWSRSLSFTVSRSGKTLLGSAVSGEGLVNTYSGTGKVLMTPVR